MSQIFFLNLFHKALLKIENMYYFWEGRKGLGQKFYFFFLLIFSVFAQTLYLPNFFSFHASDSNSHFQRMSELEKMTR